MNANSSDTEMGQENLGDTVGSKLPLLLPWSWGQLGNKQVLLKKPQNYSNFG